MEKLLFKKGLNHSNSQPYLKYYNKRNHNHLLSQSTYNNKNIDLPQIGNKIKYENGGGSYRRTLQSFDSNLDSSLHYSTKKSKKAFSDYIRYASFKAKKDNYNAQKKLNDILYETKKLPSILDLKLNSDLRNRKLKERINEEIKMSQLRRLDAELSRQRALDDLRFKRDLDEIENKRENIRLKRNRMLDQLKDQELFDFENSLFLAPSPYPLPAYYPPINAYPPPQYYLPPMYNTGDSIGDLVKFFLVKKLFDEAKNPIIYPQYPYYLPGYPYPFMFDPGKKGKIKPIPYQMPPIIIQNQRPNTKPPPKKQDNDNILTESQKGIPFVDPLEKYLDMVNRLKKTTKQEMKKAKKGNKKQKDEDDEENGGDDEEGGGDMGEDGEGGEGDGEGGDDDGGNGDEEGDGDGDGDGGDE